MNKKIITIFGIALALIFVSALAVFNTMLSNSVEDVKMASYENLGREKIQGTYFENGEVVSGSELIAYLNLPNPDGVLAEGSEYGTVDKSTHSIDSKARYKITVYLTNEKKPTYVFTKI